ncbi:Phosphatidate cytidylyltransferase, mitochondrial [Sergentomyia squamirostris]
MGSVGAGLDLCRRIIKRFPHHLCFSFAYGSGVKSQIGYEKKQLNKNVVDLVLCIEDEQLQNWHTENIQKNPEDYSGMKILGSSVIAKYQTIIPAQVYCNTLIPIKKENITIKYGVTRKSDLIKDLTHWQEVYLSGRLQKPVQFIQEPDEIIRKALRRNLQTALTVALLLLPEKFNDYNLFHTIAQLSYSGDFRMIFGENPNKVKNIVQPQLDSFRELYKPFIFAEKDHLHFPGSLSGEYSQDKSDERVFSQLKSIPFIYSSDKLGKHSIGNYRDEVKRILGRRVFRSSALQSLKNIPTAGIIKSLKYSYKKALKTFSH